MSYKALKFRVWCKPNSGEVRVYVDTKYVEHRIASSMADGCYLKANEDGSLGWSVGWTPGPQNMARSERAHFGMTDPEQGVLAHIRCTSSAPMPTFAEFLARINACQTKGGNFSYAKYEKVYSGLADA